MASSANGIALEWESFGDPRDPAFLLLAGMGAQLLFWQEAFCERLAARAST